MRILAKTLLAAVMCSERIFFAIALPRVGQMTARSVESSPKMDDDDRICEYFESSAHRGPLADATQVLMHRNPICGDEVTVALRIDDGVLTAVRFQARGCIVSQAAAAMLCEYVEGKHLSYASAMSPADMLAMIGIPLTARRIQCGLLAFEALKTLLRAAAGS